ncbi:MAG: hypothetical protein GY766_05995 [Herbaspirillum sp.]|nr:hypothetical protein [Herbaspirillum sp.]
MNAVYQLPKLFPTPKHHNVVISISGIGANKAFGAFVSQLLPDLEMISKGQCFPLYWYEKSDGQAKPQNPMFAAEVTPDADGYIRHDAITD